MLEFNLDIMLTFLAYIAVIAAITIYSYRRTRTTDDYFIGGRKIGKITSGLSAGASDMSSWLLLGLPGIAFNDPVQALMLGFGLAIGQFFNILIVGKKIRVYSEGLNAITIPDYLHKRLDDSTYLIKMLSAATIIVFFCIYISSGLVASSKIFNYALGIDSVYGIFIGLIIILLQTTIGGYTATSITDAFQALFISATVMLVIAITYISLVSLYDTEIFIRSEFYSTSNMGFTLLSTLSMLAWGLGYFGQPHILARFKSIDRPSNMGSLLRVCMIWTASAMIAATAAGYLASIYSDALNIAIDDPERSLFFISVFALGSFGGGLIIASVFSAMMSTANTQMVAVSAVITKDIIGTVVGKDKKISIGQSRVIMTVIAAIALILALNSKSTVFGIVSFAWAGLGASIGPIILITSLSRGLLNWCGGIACIVSGFISSIAFHYITIAGIYELLPAFVLASIVAIGVSYITKVFFNIHTNDLVLDLEEIEEKYNR